MGHRDLDGGGEAEDVDHHEDRAGAGEQDAALRCPG